MPHLVSAEVVQLDKLEKVSLKRVAAKTFCESKKPARAKKLRPNDKYFFILFSTYFSKASVSGPLPVNKIVVNIERVAFARCLVNTKSAHRGA